MQNDMRDRLVELLQEYTDNNNGGGSNHRRADHLIANGVIVMPCKVGDTVYYLDGTILVESKVHCISFGGRYGTYSQGQIHIYDSDKDNITQKIEQFGKTVFLTKEQAEQKLKELSENG